MMKRTLRVLGVLVLLLATSACTTLSGGSRHPVVDRIQETGVLRVGMTGDYPPLNVLDRSGTNIGLEPDLAHALARALDVELEVVNKPFVELLPALKAGEVDLVMSGMTMTPERNLGVAFAGPYFVSGKAVLTKSSTLARTQSFDALDRSQISLAVLDGSTSQTFLQRSTPNAEVMAAPTYDAAIQMVLDGTADALIADYPVCVLAVMRNPDAGLATVVSPLSFEPIGMALSADDPLFVNLVQNYLVTLEGTGLMEELRRQWFENPSWLAEVP